MGPWESKVVQNPGSASVLPGQVLENISLVITDSKLKPMGSVVIL